MPNKCYTLISKWGHFHRAKPIFKMLPVSWAEIMLTIGSRSFQRGTMSLFRSKDYHVTSCQTFEDDPIFQELNPGRPFISLTAAERFFPDHSCIFNLINQMVYKGTSLHATKQLSAIPHLGSTHVRGTF